MIAKIVQNLLMPSTLVIIFVIVGLFLLKKKNKKAKIFIVAGLFFYYFFSITPVSDFMLMSLEEKYSYLQVDEMKEVDKTVLLLGGRESNVLRGSEVLRIWHMSDEMKLIISGADPDYVINNEASAVRNFFIHRGVDPDDIIIEGESRNTRENVEKVTDIVGDEPFFLVTSAFHMERSIREFSRLGAKPIPAPADFKGRRVSRYGFLDFVPSGRNLRNSDLVVHEFLGTIYYRIIYILER